MRNGQLSFTWRQALWVAAGAVALTFFVIAASWLFTPRPEGHRAAPAAAPVTEGTTARQTFVPETVDPDRGRREGAQSTTTPPAAEEAPPMEPVTSPAAAPEPTPWREEAPAPIPPSDAAAPRPAPERPSPPPPAPSGFGVQVGAYASLANARDTQGRLSLKGFTSAIISRDDRHKVVVTGFADRAQAERAQARVRAAGFDSAFVVALEER